MTADDGSDGDLRRTLGGRGCLIVAIVLTLLAIGYLFGDSNVLTRTTEDTTDS